MKHPRDIYIRACTEAGKYNGFDYFSYSNFRLTKEIDTRYKGLVRALIDIDNAPKRIKDCYLYYKDAESRIYLEGLLLSYPLHDIASLKGFTIEFLDDYMSYFFDIEHIKGTNKETIFIKTINEEEVEGWFTKCRNLDWPAMVYLITGNSKVHPAIENLQTIRSNFFDLYKASMPVDKIMNSKGNLNARDRMNLDMSVRFADLCAKYAFNEIKLSDHIQKSNTTLKEDWRVLVKKSPSTIYDLPLTASAEIVMGELEEQFGQFPGLRVPESEQLSEILRLSESKD